LPGHRALSSIPPGWPEAILVADDEPGVRESLAEILRDAGYEVQAAADGTAALAALDARDFGLVITDIRMPGADGIAVLKRAQEVSPQTLVLVMTAHGSVETAVEALRAGATDYILKPVVRLRHDLEVIVGRLRRDVEGFMARSREEVLKDVRDVERRMLEVLHGATREQVGRLERRIARLEQTVTRLQRGGDENAA